MGSALEKRSQAVLIVEQSAAIQVNGLSACRLRLMCDLEGQPVALQQTSPPHAAHADFGFPTTPSGLAALCENKYLIKHVKVD